MKYDRPVRELLGLCVSSLPQPFSKVDVFEWFRANYPDIAESTVKTHIAGLTVGSRPHAHLATFAPVMERVGHGLYRRTASAVTAPKPSSASGARSDSAQRGNGSSADIVLIGCVKSKLTTAAPAKDLYTSALFARRRGYAEASTKPWFIVSGRLGLVAPDEIIAPYELYLPAMSQRYRNAWG